jgi:hypothetical protein
MKEKDNRCYKFVCSKKIILQIENIIFRAGQVQIEDCYIEGDYLVRQYRLQGRKKEVYHLDISYNLTKDEGIYSMKADEIQKLLINSSMSSIKASLEKEGIRIKEV